MVESVARAENPPGGLWRTSNQTLNRKLIWKIACLVDRATHHQSLMRRTTGVLDVIGCIASGDCLVFMSLGPSEIAFCPMKEKTGWRKSLLGLYLTSLLSISTQDDLCNFIEEDLSVGNVDLVCSFAQDIHVVYAGTFSIHHIYIQ